MQIYKTFKGKKILIDFYKVGKIISLTVDQ